MRKLLIPILMLISGCTFDDLNDTVNTNPSTLKFHAGQEVGTTIKFYAQCERGIIQTYHSSYSRQQGPLYFVNFYCAGAGWIENVQVRETDLTAK